MKSVAAVEHHEALAGVPIGSKERGVDLDDHIEIRVADRLDHPDRLVGRLQRVVIGSSGNAEE